MGRILLAFALLLPLTAQAGPNDKVIDNKWVTARKLVVTQDTPYIGAKHDHDAVLLMAGDGWLQDRSGKATAYHFGDAIFVPKGRRIKEELVQAGTLPVVEVVLKDRKAPHANTTGLPLAFPRKGAHNSLNNRRVAVWVYSWGPGETTSMHYHDKDIVGVFRYDGPLKSTDPAGKSTIIRYQAGEVRFTPGDRSHREGLVSGRQSAILMELK
jgi:quercetin dioxygenase-like cupin family protein